MGDLLAEMYMIVADEDREIYSVFPVKTEARAIAFLGVHQDEGRALSCVMSKSRNRRAALSLAAHTYPTYVGVANALH